MTGEGETKARGTGLMDILAFCARQFRILVLMTALGAVLSVVLALVLPSWYQAKVQLLAGRPMGGKGSGLLGAASQMLSLEAMGLSGADSGVLVGILQSRTVIDTVIAKFDLGKVYQIRTPEETRRELAKRVLVLADRQTGIVAVIVDDRLPARARDIANALADEVNRLNSEIEMRRSGQERRFLDKRLGEVRKDLATAEVAFKEFKAKYGMVDINEQTKATVRAIASLRAEMITREIQLSYVRSFAGADEQHSVRARREIAEIKRQLEKLEQAPPELKKGGKNVVVPVGEIPGLALEYARKLRELKIQEAVFELLTKQHELAKLGEVRDTADAQIIDRAVLPVKRAWPKRFEVVLIGTLLSLALGVLIALLRDALRRDSQLREQLRQLVDTALRRRPTV